MTTRAGTWLFDLGNTRLKFAGIGADGAPGPVRSIAHAGRDDFAQALEATLPQGARAVVASVAAPALRESLLLALAARFGHIELASTQAQLDGLRIAYADPRRLGVDRWLALLAVRAQGHAPALLVGVGTAITIDLLDGEGRHHGGLIAPAPRLMREALHARAAQLPPDGGNVLDFATDTTDALASGCHAAAAGLVERSMAAAEARIGRAPALLLHGGGAAQLLPAWPRARLHEHLVLQGLARWAALGA